MESVIKRNSYNNSEEDDIEINARQDSMQAFDSSDSSEEEKVVDK